MKNYTLMLTYEATHGGGIRDNMDKFSAESFEAALKKVEEESYFWDFNRIVSAKLFEGESHNIDVFRLEQLQSKKKKN